MTTLPAPTTEPLPIFAGNPLRVLRITGLETPRAVNSGFEMARTSSPTTTFDPGKIEIIGRPRNLTDLGIVKPHRFIWERAEKVPRVEWH